jgi:hypothetical protein
MASHGPRAPSFIDAARGLYLLNANGQIDDGGYRLGWRFSPRENSISAEEYAVPSVFPPSLTA